MEMGNVFEMDEMRVLVGYAEDCRQEVLKKYHKGEKDEHLKVYRTCADALNDGYHVDARALLGGFGPFFRPAIIPFLLLQGEGLEEATFRMVEELGLPTIVRSPGRVDHIEWAKSGEPYARWTNFCHLWKYWLTPVSKRGMPYITETSSQGFAVMQKRFAEQGSILETYYHDDDENFAGDINKMWELVWQWNESW